MLRHPRATSIEMKCRYAYKNCPNTRSTKDNGDLHTLCSFHRSKANVVQKIYARKRRLLKRQQRDRMEADKKAKAQSMDPIPYHQDPKEISLTQDDVATLQELFEKL